MPHQNFRIATKRAIIAFFATALFLPFISFAVTSEDTSGNSCPDIKNNLTYSSSGNEVKLLQEFLISHELLAENLATGFFGKITEGAVQQLQSKLGIVSSGTPNETGFGCVGPKTRSILRSCGSTETGNMGASFFSFSSRSCTFNGKTITSGSSVTAYQKSSVPTGSACISQARKCTNGILSGTYAYASCTVSVPTPKSCTFNGTTVADGASVTAYLASSVPLGSTCSSQVRKCTSGTLSGTYTYASCAVSAPASCSFNGTTIPNGTSIVAYKDAVSSSCMNESRVCFNGTLSGTYTNSSCSATTLKSCSWNGQTIASGASVTAFKDTLSAPTSACASQARTCTDGVLSGTYANASCNTAFNTNRSQKILGVAHLGDATQVPDLFGSSNAFAFSVPAVGYGPAISDYLTQNNSKLLPIIGIRPALFDMTTGLMYPDYATRISVIAGAISGKYTGPVLFYFDEMLWNVRMICGKGVASACTDVNAGFPTTLASLSKISTALRNALPGSGIVDISAYAEMIQEQKQFGKSIFMPDAEYLAFDCYGPMASCGGYPQTTYLEWVKNAISAFEITNTIGRKALLVPGAFFDSNSFPPETVALQQWNDYMTLMDAQPKVGGSIAFTWGDITGDLNGGGMIGARSINSLRNAISLSYRARGVANTQAFPPALSLAITDPSRKIASLTQMGITSGSTGNVYLHSAGVDSCTIKFGGIGTPVTVSPNQLSYVPSPAIIGNTPVTATCKSGTASYTKTATFILR